MVNNLRGTVARISLSALYHNIKSLHALVGPDQIFCPMVKANAYGHDVHIVAPYLEKIGVKMMGVVLVEEALALRQMGVKTKILVFSFYNEEAIKECIHHNITPVISEWKSLEIFNQEAKKRNIKISVHLKFNTGMNRAGFDFNQAQKLSEFFRNGSALKLEGICTHLLNSEDLLESTSVTKEQINIFKTQIEPHFKEFNPSIHYLNSGGVLLDQEKRAGARPGISIYGLKPSSQFKSPISLKPVMKWVTRLGLIRDLKKGESVSYGAKWTADKNCSIGVLPVGYGDGYFRVLSNKSRVLIRGESCPIRGIVCMDYMMVDVSNIKDKAQIGDEVVLIGDQLQNTISTDELADLANTISYEVVTRVSNRVPRVAIEEANG